MPYSLFELDIYSKFIIDNINSVTSIKVKDQFISCGTKCSKVDLYLNDDKSGNQKWIIEKDKYIDIYTIRSKSTKKYLGSEDGNKVILFDSINENTKWIINKENTRNKQNNLYSLNLLKNSYSHNLSKYIKSQVFTTESNIFILDNLLLDTPINLINTNNEYLLSQDSSKVYFLPLIQSIKEWEISRNLDNTYSIKSIIDNKFLGSPNLDNIIYKYTFNNEFTKWDIKKGTLNDTYLINYVGSKFDVKQKNIVVARYNENLNWLLPYIDLCTVYNKGHDDIINFKNVFKLPNVGRESHTYLYHIINNYENLSTNVVFIQGNNDDDTKRNGLPDVYLIDKQRWGDQPKSCNNIDIYLEKDIFWVNNLRPSLLYCGKKYGKVDLSAKWLSNLRDSDETLKSFFNKYIKSDSLNLPEIFYWFEKAQFTCPRDNILCNSKDYYEKLINIISDHNNPIEGHYFERCWYYIFHRNEDIYKDSSKNIFTIWTKNDINLNKDIKACFISMAVENPDKNIYIYSNIIPINFLKEHSNIYVIRYSLDLILVDTPAFNDYFVNKDKVSLCKYWYSHETDLLRFVLLYKYGGIYLDSDIFILKSINYETIKNKLSFEDEPNKTIASAFLCFDKRHSFLEYVLNQFWINWNSNQWSCVGPGLLTKCYNEEIQDLLDYNLFFPYSWKKASYYGLNIDNSTKFSLNYDFNESIGIHLWNSRFKKHLFGNPAPTLLIDTNSIINKLMSKYVNLELVKSIEIDLDIDFMLKKCLVIDTLHYLYNKNSNKYLIFDYIKKKFIDHDKEIDESSIILYFNNKINIISLNPDIEIITFDIGKIQNFF